MNIDVTNRGAFGSALVTLQPGEEFVSEAGAMYRASGNMEIEVKTRKHEGGGLWGALKEGMKAMVAGESFSYRPTASRTNSRARSAWIESRRRPSTRTRPPAIAAAQKA